ncbi:MAG: choice-of-anchor Q domain-containing protein [Crocosphaera sp.]|nr:choice-of-anchor Q domain-containing protein [Crocosphaera sp.]
MYDSEAMDSVLTPFSLVNEGNNILNHNPGLGINPSLNMDYGFALSEVELSLIAKTRIDYPERSDHFPVQQVAEETHLNSPETDFLTGLNSSQSLTSNSETITLTVNSTIDENDGSAQGAGLTLRDAIMIANSNLNSRYIIQLTGDNLYDLSLTGTREDKALTGDLDILNDITISTIGSDKATINAHKIDRVFHVHNGGKLSLNNVIVTGGEVAGSDWESQGAGILVEAEGMADITNSILEENRIGYNYSLNQDAGGAVANHGTLEITSSILRRNYANNIGSALFNAKLATATIADTLIEDHSGHETFNNGGTLYNELQATLNISHSVIRSNRTGQTFSLGGGLTNYGTANITHSTFDGNSAREGGAIYNARTLPGDERGLLNLSHSMIRHNTARNGGGLANDGGIITVEDSEIIFNTAANNGGGFFQEYYEGETRVTNTIVSDNRSGDKGGGFFIGYNSSLTLDHASVERNETNIFGAGIYIDGTAKITASLIGDNRTTARYGEGAGVYIDRLGEITLSQTIIRRNFSDYIGAGLSNKGLLVLRDSHVSENRNYNDGAGLHNENMAVITGTTFESNRSEGQEIFGRGAAIVNDSQGELFLDDSYLLNNYSTGDGGALFNKNRAEISHTTIANNITAQDGGGAYNTGDLYVTNSTITHNRAENGQGGGVINVLGTALFSSTTLSYNVAHLGGGFYNSGGDSQGLFYHSTVNDNRASLDGGGIFNRGDGSGASPGRVHFHNSTLSRNQAQRHGGGFFNADGYFGGAIAYLANSTVAENVADSDNDGIGNGGGFYTQDQNVYGGVSVLLNTIIANNFDTPDNNGPGLIHADVSGFFFSNNHNLIGVSFGGEGFGERDLLDVDPLLGSLEDNGGSTKTHRLLLGSLAIDAGDNSSIPSDLLDLDGDGDSDEAIPFDQRGLGFSRIKGLSVDLGSFEV